MDIVNTINISIILLLLCVFYLMWYLDRKKKRAANVPDDAEKSSDNKKRAKWLEKLVDTTLKSLNCETEWESDHGDRIVKYQYQNGHFRIRVEPGTPYLGLSYLFCYNSPSYNINLARIVCNQCNLNTNNERVVYSVNEAKNEVDVHILAGLLINKENARETLAECMSDVFSWQTAFVRRFEDLVNQGDAENGDPESLRLQRSREVFLLRQQEMNMQHSGEMRYNLTDKLRLGQFLEKAMGLADVIPHNLNLWGGGQRLIKDQDEILNTDLLNPDNRMLSLCFESPKQPDIEQNMMIFVNDAGDDGQTAYKRITSCLEPVSPRSNEAFSFSRQAPVATSVLVAQDRLSPQSKLDEFNYMWKEALQKLKKGEEDTLTDEQRMICDCHDRDTARSLYEGRKLYQATRYYEALLHLENAYRRMLPGFDQMKQAEKETFFEVSYLIGFCYCDLRQYDKAMYYLDLISGLHRINYTEELINCMVNSGDFRALGAIDNLLSQLDSNREEDEEENPPAHIVHFVSFLKRRKAYLLVDKDRFDDARQLLNSMLDDPDNADFAINELAYIQKLERDLNA